MAEDKNLELKSIIQKFSQSTNALDGLAERISSLSQTSDEIRKSGSGITESNIQMRRIVDELGGISKELKRANVAVQSALDSVTTFLHGTELGAMKKGIDRVENLLMTQLSAATTELQTVRSSEQEVRNELTQLKSKVNQMPDKIKKKQGFTS